MAKIAIFGGSFDPPTLGHVMVVSHLLLNEPEIDEILIIPCYQQEGKSLSPFNHRFHMTYLAFSWLPKVKFSQVEYYLGGESVTARTIRYLKQQQPQDHFRFVIGADLKDQIKSWEDGDYILQEAPPLVVGRAGIPSPESNPTPISPLVSSTMVRKALKERNYEEAERFLPRKVLGHIKNFGLYRE